MSKKIVQGRTSSIIMTSQSINNSQQKQKSATMKRISLKLKNTKTRRNSHWNVVPTGGDGSSMWESFEEAEDQSQSSQEASTPPPSGHLYSEIITTIESSVAKTRPRDQGQPRASSSTKAATGTPGKRNVTPQKHEADLSTGLSGYFCTCGLKFKLEDNLTKHIEWTNKMYSNDRKFRCKICEKRFTRNGELRKHLRRVHNVTFTARSQGYGCTVCGRLFSRLNELVRHRRSVHGRSRVVFSNKAKKVKPLPGLRPITSLINDKVTIPVPSAPPPSSPPPTQTNHKAISRIRRIPPVKIPSSQMQTLSVTKKKHEVDRSKRHLGNYCVCGTRARNPNNLRTHIKYFTSEHKFACKICGRHFLYLTYLKHHMSRVHKITDLEQVGSIGCGDCGQSFPSAKEHAQHRKSAHSNPPAVAASRRPEQLPVIATTMLALATMPGVVPQASSSSSGQSTSTFLPSSARPPNPKQYCGKKRKKVSAVSPLQRHGINLSKLPSEHFCVCGSHFETMVALREHILLLVRNESAVTTPRNDSGCPPSTTKLTPNQHGHNTVSLSESVTITQTPSDSSRASASKNQSSHSQEPSLLKLHKAVRFSNNPDVFFCFCGHQCESNQQLRQHIEDANQLQVVSTSLQLSEVTITPRPQCQERPSTTTELAPGSSSPSTSRGTETNPVALVHALDKSKEHLGIFCICNLELSSEDHLAAHLQYFALGKKFPCDMCKKLFPGIGALNKHRKLIHKTIDASGKLGCNGCGVIFSTRREIAKHRVKIFTSGGKLANVFCPARILGIVDVASGSNNDSMEHSVNDIQTDETSHGTPPTLATQIAAANSTENWIPVTPSISVRLGPSSNDAEILTPNTTNNPVEPVTSTVHPSTSDQLTDVSRPPHGIDSSKCVLGKFYCYCGQECSTKHTLNRHIRRFTEKFHCRNCGQTFLTAGLLNNHMLRVHKIVQTPSVTCKECTESFPNNMELYHHYRIVHNHGSQWETWEMKYAPPQTPSSSQQDQLSQELPIEIENDTVSKEREDDIHEPVPQDPLSDNTGSRYLCTCGKEFNYPHSLRTHVRAKTNGKIFKCSWCPTRFDQHSNLKKHVRGVHKLEYQNGKFACGICAQTFATHEEVNSHRVTAHHRNRQTQRNRHPLPDNFSETGQVEMDVVVET